MEDRIEKDFEGEETLYPAQSLQPDNSEDINDIYPDAVLNIARETASVFQMKRKWEKVPPMLDLTPPFQRDMVWTPKQKSELIESIIMGIPLPAFYVKETAEGVYVVVDGKQRLGTLFDFINGQFRLEHLSILRDHNGYAFDRLSSVEQNKIEDYTLSINVIRIPTSDRVTFDLFDRVNRGGTRLNNQEMRNALYQGTSTELLKELSSNENFLKATERSIPSKHMKDRYMILRFLAFYLWRQRISKDVDTGLDLEYKSNLEDFLGKTMSFINKRNKDDDLIIQLTNVFDRCMRLASEYIVPLGGFRLKSMPGKNKRPVNMAFFESFSYLISQLKADDVDVVGKSYDYFIQNDDYLATLTYSVDSGRQTIARYDCIQTYIDDIYAGTI